MIPKPIFTTHGFSLLVKKQLIFLINIFLCIMISYRSIHAQEIELPDMGASSSVALTPHMEEQIGREIATQIRTSHQVIDDLELNEYLQNLGYSLVANSDDAYQNFHFFLIGANQINAFATPGGVVAVYSGLFLTTETESELASVLGHEIAHVTQRHLARSFEQANQLSLPIMVGMIAGILLGAASGDGSLGAAAAMGLSAAGQQAQINYTRANEKEADRVGMRYLNLSGYNPSGMPDFFQKLERKNRYIGQNYPEFLRSHPITVNRIAEATQRAEQYRHKKRPQNTFKSALTYHLMKAKLTVIGAANDKRTVQYYRAKTEQYSQDSHPQYYYGYALALFQRHSYNQAIKILEQLKQASPNNTSYIVALAKAYIALEQKKSVKKGLQLFADALKNKPYNLVLSVNYAYALIHNQRLPQAILLLENYNKDNFKHPAIYKLLSIAFGKQNKLVKAHIAESYYYALNGLLEAAVEQLEIARKMIPKNDFYTLSKLDARKLALQQEQQLYNLDKH
jgi:predicted Zn-dependent protease